MSQSYSRKPMIQCGRIIRILADGVELCTLKYGHEGECLRPEFSAVPFERYLKEGAWTKDAKSHSVKVFRPCRLGKSLAPQNKE